MTDPAKLIEAAFDVCTALDSTGVRAVLTGGSAATFYAPEAYQSDDIDFVLDFSSSGGNPSEALKGIGFELRRDRQSYERNGVTLEFPRGPLQIGTLLIAPSRHSIFKRNGRLLRVLTPTDTVCNRLISYYAWNDFSARAAAVSVALAHAENVDLVAVRDWTQREFEELHADQRELFNGFRLDLQRTGWTSLPPPFSV